MPRPGSFRNVFCLCTGVLLLARSALAAEPARFSYAAPAECPGVEDFAAEVRERSLHERPAATDELALLFIVTLSGDETGFLGRVEFTAPDGTPVSRAVRGATCNEVVSGIALITALAIDARADAEPKASVVEPGGPNVPSVPDEESPALAKPEPPRRKHARRASTAFFTAGFGAGYLTHAGPTGGLGLDAFLSAANRPGGAALRLSAWHWRASGSLDDDLAADFRGWGGRVDACPYGLETRSLFATACAGADVGLFRAAGVPSPRLRLPREPSILWLDVALLGRAGLILGRRLVLEAELGLTVPLVRQDFAFGTLGPTLFSVPEVGGTGVLHAGVRFP